MTLVQLRNVPPDLHRRMKARAALEGKTLSEYVLGEISRSLERPTRAELIERIRGRSPIPAGESAADAVRAERDAR